MERNRKTVNTIAGVAIIGGIIYYSYSFGSAEGRIRSICADITPGMPFNTLLTFAKDHGLSQPQDDSGVSYITENKTFGRWGCRVVLNQGLVQIAEYNYVD